MLLAGDEMGRTQRGNNNAYCQDNEISWVDWAVRAEDDQDLLDFVRRAHPAAAPTTRCSAAAGSSRGQADPRRRGPAGRHRLVHPGRARR